MIISKTPYRVSLLGGGSDLPAYFKKNGGEVIGFSINYYSYISVKKINRILDYKYRIIYSKEEIPKRHDCKNYRRAIFRIFWQN